VRWQQQRRLISTSPVARHSVPKRGTTPPAQAGLENNPQNAPSNMKNLAMAWQSTPNPAGRWARHSRAAKSPALRNHSQGPNPDSPRSSANGERPPMNTGVIDRFTEVFTQYIDSGFGLLNGEVAFSWPRR